MQQHPVPQNIMQVEFQLVGNMTIRQFLYIAAAGILAWLIIASPLVFAVKWSLVALVAATGAGLAFLPINDIPLDRWVTIFINAIFAPTLRVWKKESKLIDFLTSDYAKILSLQTPKTTSVEDRGKLERYLSTLGVSVAKTDLDIREENYLSSLDFAAAPSIAATVPPPVPLAPPEEITTEKRVVEEIPERQEKLAGEVSFKPVATIHLPEKNVYVRPLSNVRSRSLRPTPAISGTINLPIRGEKVFQISESLKERLQEKIQEIPKTQIKVEPIITQVVTIPPPVVQAIPPEPPKIPEEPKTPDVEKDNLLRKAAEASKKLEEITQEREGLISALEEAKKQPQQKGVTKEEFEKVISDYKIQLGRVRTEREYLFSQLSDLQNQLKSFKIAAEESQAVKTTVSQELEQLKDQLKKTEGEKEVAQKSAQKMSTLLEELAKKRGVTQESILQTTNQEPSLPQELEMRVIKPKTAVGKMAPIASTVQNVITGVVKDKNGLLLPEVIIVVKDHEGEPVRALKTNKIGQFAVSTPLPNGIYTMELEKEGYRFDVYEIKVIGDIITPIEVRAK